MSSALVNAKMVPVVLQNGNKDQVFLRRLTIRQIYEFVNFMLADNTPELVRLCADKKQEWIDELSDESFAELAGMCVEQNFQRARTMAEKGDAVLALKIAPLQMKLASMLRTAIASGLPLKNLLPAPPPSESAAATGSESSTKPQSGSASS